MCEQRLNGEMCAVLTFVEHGQNGFDVRMHLDWRRLAQREVALPDVACARSCNERIRERLSLHVLVVGPSVNVYDVACAMFHGIHLCRGDQPTLVSGVRMPGAQR
jgi:hypothetical protein